MQSAESPDDFALHLEARIGALSRVHAALNSSGADGVEMQDLLRVELTANAVRETQFEVTGPSVRLRARGAETMGLVFHELVTNSLKFGALATPSSKTHINWEIRRTAAGSWLCFRWTETQTPRLWPGPLRRGFGREVIEQTLPYEFEAHTGFELTPEGLLCTIDLPLNARTANSIRLQQRVIAQELSNAASNPAAP
jgi:two-component system CheB/CheR fusion protein